MICWSSQAPLQQWFFNSRTAILEIHKGEQKSIKWCITSLMNSFVLAWNLTYRSLQSASQQEWQYQDDLKDPMSSFCTVEDDSNWKVIGWIMTSSPSNMFYNNQTFQCYKPSPLVLQAKKAKTVSSYQKFRFRPFLSTIACFALWNSKLLYVINPT